MSTNLQSATAPQRANTFAFPKLFPSISFVVAFLLMANMASAQITYTWTNTSGDGTWTNALNWLPLRVATLNTDIIVINNGLMDTITEIPTQTIGKLTVSDNTSVVLMGDAATSNLTVGNSAGTDLTIANGSSLTFDGSLERLNLANGAEADISGALVVIDATYRPLANSITTVTGRLRTMGTGSIPGASVTRLFFAAGGTYEHARTGGSIPTSTWDAASTCEITGVTAGTPGGLNQTLGNLIWNCPGQTGNVNLLTTVINGDLIVIDTGNDPDANVEELRMSQPLLTIGGNFIQSGGSFRVSSGGNSRTLRVAGDFELTGGRFVLNTGNATSTGTLQIGGDFTYGAGSMFVESNNNANGLGAVIFAGNTTYTDGGTLTGNVNFTVQSGAVLQMAADNTIVPGSGSFLLQTTSRLGITSPDGITTSGATGNIQVTGTRTYNPFAHYLYNGGSPQVTGSGLPVGIDSLTIDNAANSVTLTQSIGVQSAVIFEAGVLYTSSALPEILLAFGPDAVATGASQNSYVDGPVVKGGMEAFAFPIGKGGFYGPLSISAPAILTDVFRAEYFRANPANDVGSDLDGVDVLEISKTEYWDLSRVNGTSPVTITLNWDGNGDAMMADVDALRVVHFDGMQWTSAGGAASGGPDIGGTIVSDPVNSFSFFTLGSASAMNALPIELVSFTATPKASEVLLNWRTATEIDNNYFSIERSNNGRDFAEIGKVNGAGTSYQILDYLFTDVAPLQGWNYYRLKQVDFDGQFSYSPIQAVLMGKSDAVLRFTLFPNPAGNELNLKTDRLLQASDRLEIFDYMGRMVKRFSAADASDAPMDISSLPAGSYILRLHTEAGATNTSFLKQ